MKKTFKKIFVFTLMLALVMAEGFSTHALEKNISGQQITSKTVVSQSDDLILSIDELGHIEVENKSTGYVWSSYPADFESDTKTVGVNRLNFQSEVVVNYVYRDLFGSTSSYQENSIAGIDAVEGGAVKVYKTKNGAKVVYDFYSICVSVAIQYSVKDNKLSVEIIGDEILEGDAFRKKVKDYATKEQLEIIQESYVTSIWVLPSFTSGKEENKGFVFVPDGSGAFMNFEPVSYVTNSVIIPFYGAEYAIDEYGVKDEKFSSVTRPLNAYFPMFSIVKDNHSVVGIIETGAAMSALNVFKAGRANAYTGASAQMIYRTISKNLIGDRKVQGVSKNNGTFSDFKIDYHFICEKMDYADISKYYRSILEEDNKISKNKVKSNLSFNVIGAIDIDSHFLGIPCRRLKSLTSYEQLGEIISTLNSKGIDDLSVNYIGWSNNGVQNKKITNKFKALAKLGGKKDFNNLVSSLNENNIDLFLDADLQSFSKSGNGVSKVKNAIKTMFDKPALQRKFSYATFLDEKDGYMLVNINGFSNTFKKYMKSVNKYDENVGLSFNFLSSKIYSDFSNKDSFTREDLLNAYIKNLKSVKNPLSAKDANSYMWAYADKIFEAPISSSRQRIYDGEVPMYQMIIHGYIPFTVPAINSNANQNELFLRAVETGGELCFTVMYEDSKAVNGTDYDYLYSTTFSEVMPSAIDMYERYKELEKLICTATIERYTHIKNGVSETVYSNGVSVIVNYSDSEYIADDGVTVSANDFGYRR